MGMLVINEEFMQQLESLATVLHNNVAGGFGGNRSSKVLGVSSDFTDYRDYIAGDDITKIDWNAYSRFEKLYLKLYLDERQMHTRIYIDASRSMAYGDGRKAEQALRLAAAIAYLSVSEMDRASIYLIRDGGLLPLVTGINGKDSYISSIGALNGVTFDGESRISDAITPTPVGYGDGLSVIISDFLTDEDYESAIDLLADKRRDILCLQVLSLSETNPQIKGKSHLYDCENPKKFYRKNIDRDILSAYRRALEYVTSRIEEYCQARGGAYMLVSAEDSLGDVFFRELTGKGVVK